MKINVFLMFEVEVYIGISQFQKHFSIIKHQHRSGLSHCPFTLILAMLAYTSKAFWVNTKRAAVLLYSSARRPQGRACPYLGRNDGPRPAATAVPLLSIYRAGSGEGARIISKSLRAPLSVCLFKKATGPSRRNYQGRFS